MIKKDELINIIIAIVVMALVVSFSQLIKPLTTNTLLYALKILLFSSIIIFLTVFAKKLSAKSREIEIEQKILGLQRYWFTKKAHFKKPIPLGIFFPLVLTVLSTGFIKCFTLLQFEAKALPSFAAKKKGWPRTPDIRDSDLGIISFWGITSLLFLAAITSFFPILIELAKLSLYYAIWNIIPFGQLDGMKLLMSSGEARHPSGSKPGDSPVIIPLYLTTIILTIITAVIVFI